MTTFETLLSETRGRPTGAVATAFSRFAAFVAARAEAWKNRRQVATLLNWDSHMLRDIGLTKGDVYAALSGGADEDPTIRLSMLSLERRFADRANQLDRLSRGAELRVGGARYRRKS